MRTSAPIDLSFRSVDLIPSRNTSPPDEMQKAARANAHSATDRRSGERKGENERCIRTGPLALRACEQFHGMIQLRVCAFLHRHGVFGNDFWSQTRFSFTGYRYFGLFDVKNESQYIHAIVVLHHRGKEL